MNTLYLIVLIVLSVMSLLAMGGWYIERIVMGRKRAQDFMNWNELIADALLAGKDPSDVASMLVRRNKLIEDSLQRTSLKDSLKSFFSKLSFKKQ